MKISVKEDFCPLFGPPVQSGSEWRAGKDRRVAPMVWNHEHRKPSADVRSKQLEQPVEVGFEPRRDVVNGR
jgi:hypothetical protein